MSKKKPNREKILKQLIDKLSSAELENIRLIIKTAEIQGNYTYRDDGTSWNEDVASTLNCLANEFRTPN